MLRTLRYGVGKIGVILRAVEVDATRQQAGVEVGWVPTDAVVLGGSVAGLLCARVLLDAGARVALVERDRLDPADGDRRGVPQAAHPHILLCRGRDLLHELVPGLREELLAGGGVEFDSSAELAIWNRDGRGRQIPSDLPILSVTRELFDRCLRARVLGAPGLRLIDGTAAHGLLGRRDGGVAGLRVHRRDRDEQLHADLVVDASGRGSRTPRWLAELGAAVPPELVVDPRQGYASRLFRPPPGWSADWKAVYVPPLPPDRHRGGVLLPVEGGRWLVGLTSRGPDPLPGGEAAYRAFAGTLPGPMIAAALESAEPLGPIRCTRATGNRWLRYDRLTRPVPGLVVTGDAACAFNPVYGQGLTSAALGAAALRDGVRETGGRSGLGSAALARQVAAATATAAALPWLLSTGQDARFPTTRGAASRPLDRLVTRYVDRLTALSAQDPVVRIAQLEVFHLLRPATALFAPRLVLRAATPRRLHPVG